MTVKSIRVSMPWLQRAFALTVVSAASILCSSDRHAFTSHDKAYYAAENLVNFVRPGLVIKITQGSVGQDGTMQLQFTVTDPKGLPLDVLGVTTPGTVATNFVAGYIPGGQIEYISLIARPATGAAGTANQPAADRAGTLIKTADGQYTYSYGARAPTAFDRRQTVSFGIYASRDLSEFELGTNVSNDVFTFVPNGSSVVDAHDDVRPRPHVRNSGGSARARSLKRSANRIALKALTEELFQPLTARQTRPPTAIDAAAESR